MDGPFEERSHLDDLPVSSLSSRPDSTAALTVGALCLAERGVQFRLPGRGGVSNSLRTEARSALLYQQTGHVVEGMRLGLIAPYSRELLTQES